MTENGRAARRRRKAELAIRALATEGHPKAAAAHLGITQETVRRLVREYCDYNGYASAVQAAYWLDRQNHGEIGQ